MIPNVRRFISLVAITAVCCSCSTDFKELPAKKSLEEVSQSDLVIVPKKMASGFFLETAQTDAGGGSNPLTGADAKKAKRFSGAFAQNSNGGDAGGELTWCVAKPADFDSMCDSEDQKVYFNGTVNGRRVLVSATNYPNPPKSSSDFTEDVFTASWVKEL